MFPVLDIEKANVRVKGEMSEQGEVMMSLY